MEISYKKDGNRNFMILKDWNIDEEDYKLQMVMNNDIKGLVPMNIMTVNNNKTIHYGITSMVSLENMYTRKRMNGSDVYNFIRDIKNISDNMKEYLLDINNIIFSPECIYYKQQTGRFEFCYLPDNQQPFQEGIRIISEKVLECINHNDKKAVLIAYGIQQITINCDFTIQDLMECADKNIGKADKANIKTTGADLSRDKDNLVGRKDITDRDIKKKGAGIRKCQEKEIGYNNEYEFDSEKESVKKGGIIQGLRNMLKGKKYKYKNESEIIREDLTNYGNEIETDLDEVIAEQTDQLENEEATMLLTSSGAISTITLRCTDIDNPQEITPNNFPCIIGKSRQSSTFFIDNPVISRVHMKIVEDMAGYFVEDLNSTNGTFINGIRLEPHEPQEINVGDQITIANMEFIVE